jgi:hypothetical protein
MTFLDHLLSESASPEATARREREAAAAAAKAESEARFVAVLRDLATALDRTNTHDHHADLDAAGIPRR